MTNTINITSTNSQSTMLTSRSSTSQTLLEEESTSNNSSSNNNNNSIVILSCGNGVPFEYFHKNRYWLNYYLNQDIHICLWNYKGYGLNKGTTSFTNMKEDVESVFQFLSEQKKYKNIIAHGISLGGVPTCHLAA